MPAAERRGHEVFRDAAELRRFFDETHQRLFGGLCLVTGDRHEAQEIMQDAYLQLWERCDPAWPEWRIRCPKGRLGVSPMQYAACGTRITHSIS
jgi:hypothetical protein